MNILLFLLFYFLDFVFFLLELIPKTEKIVSLFQGRQVPLVIFIFILNVVFSRQDVYTEELQGQPRDRHGHHAQRHGACAHHHEVKNDEDNDDI
jgi:hypothetical protein